MQTSSSSSSQPTGRRRVWTRRMSTETMLQHPSSSASSRPAPQPMDAPCLTSSIVDLDASDCSQPTPGPRTLARKDSSVLEQLGLKRCESAGASSIASNNESIASAGPVERSSSTASLHTKLMQAPTLKEAGPIEWVYPGGQVIDIAEEKKVEPAENEEEEAEARVALFTRSKVVSIGRDHPDALCEPRAVRDTVPEPLTEEDDIRIPMSLVREGALSSPQLESIALAARRFRRQLPSGERCGFLLGDGTGCGKGRCIAALILDQWNRGGRRHVWISATADLHADAMRDLTDIHSGIGCCSLTRMKYGRIDEMKNAEVQKLGPQKDGVLFLTYSMLVAATGRMDRDYTDPSRSRFAQVMAWLSHRSEKGNGVICFDEAHRAKNIDKNTQVGRLVLDLQKGLPGCAILYASATGATEVQHMQYMERLGLWATEAQDSTSEILDMLSSDEHPPQNSNDSRGSAESAKNTNSKGGGLQNSNDRFTQRVSFKSFNAFRAVVEKGGVAAMELVAVQLKSMGAMSCRSLAFTGTKFDLLKVAFNDEQILKYDESVHLWADLAKFLERLKDHGIVSERRTDSAFWGAQQRYYKGLLIATKVAKTVELATNAVEKGFAVVMSLWSTNEAVIAKSEKARAGRDGEADGGAEGFLSGPELTFEQLLDNVVLRVIDEYGGENGVSNSSSKLKWAYESVEEFRARVKSLGLPPNPLDDLIDQLGGPDAVAEMSGRSYRMCRTPTGEVKMHARSEELKKSGHGNLDSVNNVEQRAFQQGRKLFAIITEAASAGISLHSDRREIRHGVYIPRPRQMLCLELPWAADKAVQQLGRVHRSNQLSAPSFTCLVTDLGGEARFISAVTQRLRQLGAMTRGDRHAALGEDDAFKFGQLDVMNGTYGRRALAKLYNELVTGVRMQEPSAPPAPNPDRAAADDDANPRQAEQVHNTEVDDLPTDWSAFSFTAVEQLKQQGLSLEEKEVMKDGGMKRFLNRLLGCTCEVQKGLFAALAAHMVRLEEADRKDGLHDNGVVSLNKQGRWGRLRKVTELRSEPLSTDAPDLRVRELQLDRGFSFEEALQLYESSIMSPPTNVAQEARDAQGFYLRPLMHSPKKEAILLLVRRRDESRSEATYIIHYPHAAVSTLFEGNPLTLYRLQHLTRLERRAHSDEEIRTTWRRQYSQSSTMCIHLQRALQCKEATRCEMGRRCLHERILTGPLLAYWTMIKELPDVRMNLVRASLTDERVLVGIMMPKHAVEELRQIVQRAKLMEEDDDPTAFDKVRQQIEKMAKKQRAARDGAAARRPTAAMNYETSSSSDGEDALAAVRASMQRPMQRNVPTEGAAAQSGAVNDMWSAFQTPEVKRAYQTDSYRRAYAESYRSAYEEGMKRHLEEVAEAVNGRNATRAHAAGVPAIPSVASRTVNPAPAVASANAKPASLPPSKRPRLIGPDGRDLSQVVVCVDSDSSDGEADGAAPAQEPLREAPRANGAAPEHPSGMQQMPATPPFTKLKTTDRMQQLKARFQEAQSSRLERKVTHTSLDSTDEASTAPPQDPGATRTNIAAIPSPPKYLKEVWFNGTRRRPMT